MTTTQLPDTITVLIDTREHYPLPFPSTLRIEDPAKRNHILTLPIATRRTALPYGDYTLDGYSSTVAIERKASPTELLKNLTNPDDLIRQTKAFARLASSCTHPALFLECAPADLLSNPHYPNPDTAITVLSRLMRLCSFYNLQFFCFGRTTSVSGRRNISTILLHWMVQTALTVVPDREECQGV